MASGIRWQGVDPKGFAAAMREAPKDVQKAVRDSMNAAVDPLKDAHAEEATKSLPSRGGLASLVAGARFTVKRKLTGSRPRLEVEVQQTKGGGRRRRSRR